MDDMEHSEFDAAFAKLAEGYREGTYEGRRFSLIVRRSGDGRRNSLFARELDGTDIVSFNLFRVTSDRTLLKPCEMSAEKVVADNVSPVQLPGEQTVATSVPRSPDDQAETPAFISPFSVSLRKLRESGIELGMLHVIHPY
jgi:hypothetical protein